MSVLKKHWFLVVLGSLIGLGLAAGSRGPRDAVDLVLRWIEPSWTTFVVLFLMAFSLESGRLWESSFRRPLPFLWASLVSSAVMPLLGWALMGLQRSEDFACGLMIAASVPCTLSTASVWTRRAGGNDAVTLLTTLLTTATCFVVAPFWLNLTTGSQLDLNSRELVVRLLLSAFAPTLLGQAARAIPGARLLAERRIVLISLVVQSFVLLMVFVAACKAGRQLATNDVAPSLGATLVVWVCCLAVHAGGMGLGMLGAKGLRFRREDVIAVAFAGSQKTLPIGLLIATDASTFGNPDLLGPGRGVPFAIFPMLMFHATQLVMDTAVAQRMAERRETEGEADAGA